MVERSIGLWLDSGGNLDIRRPGHSEVQPPFGEGPLALVGRRRHPHRSLYRHSVPNPRRERHIGRNRAKRTMGTDHRWFTPHFGGRKTCRRGNRRTPTPLSQCRGSSLSARIALSGHGHAVRPSICVHGTVPDLLLPKSAVAHSPESAFAGKLSQQCQVDHWPTPTGKITHPLRRR